MVCASSFKVWCECSVNFLNSLIHLVNSLSLGLVISIISHLLLTASLCCPLSYISFIHCQFLMLITLMSFTFVRSVIDLQFPLSIIVIPSITLSVPLFALLNVLSRYLVSVHISYPCIMTERMHWLQTLCFKHNRRGPPSMLPCFPIALQSSLICLYFQFKWGICLYQLA